VVIRRNSRRHQHRAQAGPPWNRAGDPFKSEKKTPAIGAAEARARPCPARARCTRAFWELRRERCTQHPPRGRCCRRPQHSDPFQARVRRHCQVKGCCHQPQKRQLSVPPAHQTISHRQSRLGNPGPRSLRALTQPTNEHPSRHRRPQHRPQARAVRAWVTAGSAKGAVEARKPIPRGRSA